MSYAAYGQTTTLPGGLTLPTGELVVPLPGGGTYTVGGTQAQPTPDTPAPKVPSESTMKWASFAAAAVGAVVGLTTLAFMLRGKKKS